jgi:hypothetical protein
VNIITKITFTFFGIICACDARASASDILTVGKRVENAKNEEQRTEKYLLRSSERIIQQFHQYNSISFVCEDEHSLDKKQWKVSFRREVLYDIRRNSLILKIREQQVHSIKKNQEWDNIHYMHDGIQTVFYTGRYTGRDTSAIIVKASPFFYVAIMPLNLFFFYDNNKHGHLENLLKRKEGYLIEEVNENGELLLRLQKGNAIFYFNNQSGLLVKKIRDDKIRHEKEIIEIKSYSLVEGKSIPTLIETKIVDAEGKTKHGFVRHRIIPQSIKINQEIPEAAFIAKFPSGTRVSDKIKNYSYIAQGEPVNGRIEQISNDIDKMLDTIKQDDKK